MSDTEIKIEPEIEIPSNLNPVLQYAPKALSPEPSKYPILEAKVNAIKKNLVEQPPVNPYSADKYTKYALDLNCPACAGTGIYKGTNEQCVSGLCSSCPCGVGKFTFHYLGLAVAGKVCHSCKFIYDGSSPKVGPRSQKAKGLIALIKGQSTFENVPYTLIQSQSDITKLKGFKGKFFRPCPTKPRHGFVESTVCATKKQVRSLMKQAIAQDPDAEIVVMKRIEGRTSSILIPESGVLAIGPGTDGATAGKKSVMIPCVPHHGSVIKRSGFDLASLRTLAEIPNEEHTYLELIASPRRSSRLQSYVVQARSGPPIAGGTTNFIPREEKVLEVIEPTDDLIAWEKLVLEMNGKPGIVGFKQGSTLASHAAIHCVAAGIPFITDNRPKKGTWLKPTVKLIEFNLDEFKLGLNTGWHTGVGGLFSAVPLAIAIVHNAAALRASPYWSRLFGYAAMVIFRAGALACVGESRHMKKASQTKCVHNRMNTWKLFAKSSPGWLAQKCGRLIPVFLSNEWKPSFGGTLWAECGVEVVTLYQDILAGDPNDILSGMNDLVHAAHNCGPLLNKFVPTPFFNLASELPCIALSKCGVELYRVLTKKPAKQPLKLRQYFKRSHKVKIEPVKSSPYGYIRLEITIPHKMYPKGMKLATHPGIWKPEEPIHDVIAKYIERA